MGAELKLFPGEEVVMTSENNIVVLTNRRVRLDSVVSGRSMLVSVTLDAVASCSLSTRSYPLLLVIAAFVVAAGTLYLHSFWGSALVALVLVGAYFTTRRAVLSVASQGGEAIHIPVKGMGRANAVAFIDAVERQKIAGRTA